MKALFTRGEGCSKRCVRGRDEVHQSVLPTDAVTKRPSGISGNIPQNAVFIYVKRSKLKGSAQATLT